ncbi:NDP-glycosyltransferase YjiC-like [Halichondria panicea]|uniref:NDP-glycosyltransferase YjiC-like n=1 Tax=Halichondria panicea TaxID=6063 RepID=UPI00312B5E71
MSFYHKATSMDLTIYTLLLSLVCMCNTPVHASNGVYQSPSWNDSPRKLKILILTVPGSGHTAIPLALGEELVRRGHEVTLVCSENKLAAPAEKVGVNYKNSGSMKKQYRKFSELAEIIQTGGNISTHFQLMLTLRRLIIEETDHFIDVIQEQILSGTKWDVALSTDFLESFLPCVGEMLQIPVVSLRTTFQHFPHTFPPWPWASLITGSNTDDMTFGQRLGNTLERTILPHLLSYIFTSPISDKIDMYCPAQANHNSLQLSSITFPEIVPTVIGIEFPRTISPLSHYVGPILTQNPTPCKDTLESWLNSKEDKSVIYISMGSVTLVTKELAKAFIGGIKKTNYSVLWAIKKTENFELDIDPERFFTGDWLPQMSVLKYKAISLAIMHGGGNGVHESLHSGVPLILVPGMPEQTGNARRVHHHRLGIHLNKQGLTAEQVYQSIVEIDYGDYRENVRKLQKVFRAAGGAKRAADLVEFYSEVGYDHLIPAYAKYNWSWVQYYNADVYALLLVCALVTLYIDYKILKYVYSRCCKSNKQKSD